MWGSLKRNRLGKRLNYALDNKRESNYKTANAIGVLFDVSCCADIQKFQAKIGILGGQERSVFVLICDLEKVKVDNERELYFFEEDLNWKGELSATSDAATFLNRDYKVLINYFVNPSLGFALISAQSRANVRIGFSGKEPRINDINIDVDPREIDTFVEVVKNYLPKIK